MTFKRYRITARVISDLKKRSTFGIFFYLFLSWFILLSDGFFQRHPLNAKIFIFCVSLICLFRLVHVFAARWPNGTSDRLHTVIFYFSVASTSLIWGIEFSKLLLMTDEFNTRFLMTVCSMGIAAGGVIAFTPDRRLNVSFCLLLLLPAAYSLFSKQKDIPLAVLLLLFMLYLSFIAFRASKEYWDALENEHLLNKRSRELEEISRTDSLTRLFNRRYFDEAYAVEWNRSLRNKSPISVILIDIDDFKTINDQYGHLAGDDYLRAFAGMIRSVFKRNIDLISRYGGEEFIVLMPEKIEKARNLAEVLRSTVQDTEVNFEHHTINTTISIGIASLVPKKDGLPDTLIFNADKALYQSKTTGKNKITCYSPPD